MLTEYVEKIMRNGIYHFAKQASVSPFEVQILIYWDDLAETPKYKKLVNGQPSVEVTFNQILNVKFDMMNRGAIVGQFITTTLDRYSKELNCAMSQTYVIVALEPKAGVEVDNEDEVEDELKLFLYRGKDQVKELELEQLLM